MTRELLEKVDGITVDNFALVFSGTDEVSHADARHLAYDEEVFVVVRARVGIPRLKENRNGELTRTNVLKVQETGIVRSDQLKNHLCDTLGLSKPAPTLFDASSSPAPTATIPETDVDFVDPGEPVHVLGQEEPVVTIPREPVEEPEVEVVGQVTGSRVDPTESEVAAGALKVTSGAKDPILASFLEGR